MEHDTYKGKKVGMDLPIANEGKWKGKTGLSIPRGRWMPTTLPLTNSWSPTIWGT